MGILRGMERRRPSLWASGAAAALALVTVGVFYRLQDYGPESAIRRFHTDVMNHNRADLQRVTLQQIDTDRAVFLEQRIVQGFLGQGATYQLLRMDRSPDQVRAAVVYRTKDGENWPFIWVVEKTDRNWRVNVDKTVTVAQDLGAGG
jgi:hypothetical protein